MMIALSERLSCLFHPFFIRFPCCASFISLGTSVASIAPLLPRINLPQEVSAVRYPRRLYRTDDQGELIEPNQNIQNLWLWVERFQNEFARQNRSPQTIIEYGYDLASLLSYMDELRLDSFRQVDSRVLRDYLDWLRLNEELSAVTLNRRLACLRSFFKYLSDEKVIENDPAQSIRKAKQRRQAGHTYLMAEEAAQLLSSIDSKQRFAKRDLAMISLMLFCGLRISEVAALNVSDLRFREGVISIHGKGNKMRELPISEHLEEILLAYLQERQPAKQNRGRDASGGEAQTPMELAKRQINRELESGEPLFLSSRHSRITTRAIRMTVDKYVQHIDIEDGKHISPHKLRHTFATLLYLNGADINVLSELLGHASLSTTQIYAAVDQDRKRQAMAAHPLLPDQNR